MNCAQREVWLAERRTGEGGSDAAAACGLDPWRTPLELYLDKIGELETEETPDMRRGTLLEPVTRQMYCDETGRTVVTPDHLIRNPKFPFAFANLDGIASDTIVYEGKTSRSRQGWGDPGTSDVPVHYLCQVQHYLAVTELQRADLAVLFGDFEFAIYPIEADAEFQSLLMGQEAAFWECVEKRIPPEPINHDDIKRRWPRNIVASVAATAADLEVARVLAAVKDRLKTLEGIKDEAEAALKASIKDSEGLHVGGEVLCSWKLAKAPDRFDVERFRADQPELYEQYLRDGKPTRRFLLKGKHSCLDQVTTILPEIPGNSLSATSVMASG